MQIDLSETYAFNVVGRKIYRRISVPQNHAPLQDHQLNAKVFDKDVSRASLVHESTSYNIIVLMDFVLFSSGGERLHPAK